MVVKEIFRRYIRIGGVEPLVFDKTLRRYIGIGGIEPLVVDILSFFVRGEVLWGKCQPLRQIRPETGESLANF